MSEPHSIDTHFPAQYDEQTVLAMIERDPSVASKIWASPARGEVEFHYGARPERYAAAWSSFEGHDARERMEHLRWVAAKNRADAHREAKYHFY